MLLLEAARSLLRHLPSLEFTTIDKFEDRVDRLVSGLCLVRDVLARDQVNLQRVQLASEEGVQQRLVNRYRYLQVVDGRCLAFVKQD